MSKVLALTFVVVVGLIGTAAAQGKNKKSPPEPDLWVEVTSQTISHGFDPERSAEIGRIKGPWEQQKYVTLTRFMYFNRINVVVDGQHQTWEQVPEDRYGLVVPFKLVEDPTFFPSESQRSVTRTFGPKSRMGVFNRNGRWATPSCEPNDYKMKRCKWHYFRKVGSQ